MLWDNVEKCCTTDEATGEDILRSMCFAFWAPKATNADSEWVIFIALPLQQWLHERVSLTRYLYSPCLFMTLYLSGFSFNSTNQRVILCEIWGHYRSGVYKDDCRTFRFSVVWHEVEWHTFQLTKLVHVYLRFRRADSFHPYCLGWRVGNIAKWHSVTSQKTWIFNTVVRKSNVARLLSSGLWRRIAW